MLPLGAQGACGSVVGGGSATDYDNCDSDDGDPAPPFVVVTSPNYKEVFRFWCESLDEIEYPVEKRNITMLPPLEPPYGYCTDSWVRAIMGQVEGVVEYIAAHCGEWAVFSDADLQFFPAFPRALAAWRRHMRQGALDLLFMREQQCFLSDIKDGEVNSGFYICRCSSRTLLFFEEVLARLRYDPKMGGYPPYLDQYYVNVLLHDRGLASGDKAAEFGVRWDYLPEAHCVWGDDLSFIDVAAFHHAVNTRDKPRQLTHVRKHILRRQRGSDAEWVAHVERYYRRRAWGEDEVEKEEGAPLPHLCSTCRKSVGFADGGACDRRWSPWSCSE